MGLFRGRATKPSETIVEFWSWWSGGGATACASAIADADPLRIVGEISARVSAIHPGLAWELAAGQVSEHMLVVTAEGNPELRSIARRWLLCAPPADETWSYEDHRNAAEDPEEGAVRVEGAPNIGFGDIALSARKSGTRLDVSVYHPAFADIPPNARVQVAFLALDAALGENDTELWIGEIDTSSQRPIDGFGLLGLRSLVADLRRESVDQDGRPQWALLKGEGPDGPLLASARTPLHPLIGPMFTRHLEARVPYEEQTEAGFPGPESLEALRRLEDALERAVGAEGMLVAHETTAGARTFHLYVDPEAESVDRIRHVLEQWREGKVRIGASKEDPGWEAVRHLRG